MAEPGAGVLRGHGEVAEDEADASVAAAYARLRGALGAGFVPTVWRMLARHERYLGGALAALAPLLDGGLVAPAERIRAAAAAAAGRLSAPRGVLVDAGAGVLELLDRYNEANPRSLVLVGVLARPLDGPAASVMAAPLPARGDGTLLDDVRACHGGLTVPGLWRELHAASPEAAAAGWALVREIAATPDFARARAEAAALALDAGAGCGAPDLDALATPAERSEIAGILAWFWATIPAMIVEIECLRRAAQ